MSDIRILYLPIWYPDSIDGNAGNFIYDLGHDLADTNNKIDVFYPNFTFKQKGSENLTIHKHEHITEYICHGWCPPKRMRFGLETWISKSIRVAKKHLKDKYDIIHCHGYVASFLGPKFQEVFGGKLLTTFHHSDFIENKISSYRNKKLHEILKLFQHIITPSLTLSQAIKRYFSSNSILTIPNYIDFSKVKLKNKHVNNHIKCISVGSLERIKNQEFLISEWKKLPSNFSLDIIGDGPLKIKLVRLINQENLSNQIRILSPLKKEKLLNTYHKYDITVSTSTIETFGMSMLESIGAGVPVVTTCNTGPSSYISPVNGAIVHKENFADKIICIGKNLHDYNPINLRNSIQNFNKEIVLKQYLKIYHQLLL